MESKINDIDKKLSKLIDKTKKTEEINKEINNNTILLKEQIEQMSKELEQIKKTIDIKDKDITELRKSNDFLLAENRVLKNDLKLIRTSTEELIFQQHSNELDVVGIRNCDINDLTDKILHASNKWNLKIKKNDILNIESHLMKSKNEKSFRIKFKDQQTKNDFHSEAKKSRNKERDLDLQEIKQKIYFNDVLPYYTRKIFFHARNLKKDQNWKYVWNKNGKIYIRKDDKSPAILLKSLEDIEILKS